MGLGRGPCRSGRAVPRVGRSLADDLRADSAVGENLQQQRMTEPAVDDVGLEYPGLEAGRGMPRLWESFRGRSRPAAISSRHSLGVRLRIKLWVHPCRARIPGVSVRKTSFSAWSARATAAAAVSALTLAAGLQLLVLGQRRQVPERRRPGRGSRSAARRPRSLRRRGPGRSAPPGRFPATASCQTGIGESCGAARTPGRRTC